jgi:hypothetical protein
VGLGSFWDPNDHPRGWHGRFAKKWKISDTLRKLLDGFTPRTFQSDSQAGQYAFNQGHKNGPFSSVELTRLRKDWDEAQDHIRAGDMDPQTKAFDDMMQSHMHPTSDGLIATTTFGADALGLRPDQLHDGPGGITDLFGTVLGNKGYQAVHLGTDVTPGQHGPGKISATIMVPAGTRVAFPGQSPQDRGFFLDKEQPLLVTRIDPDGMGGWRIAAVAEPHPGVGASQVSQDLNPGRKGVGLTPEERAARLAEPSTMPAPATPQAAPATEAVMRPESVQAPAVGRTPEQEAARVQRAQAGRQANVNEGNPPVQAPLPTPNPRPAPAPPPAAGPPSPTGVPDRNEPIHAPSIGGTGNEGKSASEIANRPPEPAPEPPPALSPAEQGKSLKDAYVESGIESPAAGPHRAAFNRAYLNAKSQNGHPEQALRNLEADIKSVEEKAAEQKVHPSDRADMLTAEADAKSMNDLADLIATHFGLPRAKKEEKAPSSPVQRTGAPDEFLGEKKPGAREARKVSGQPSRSATGLTEHEQAGAGPGTAGVGGRKEGAPETPAPRGSTGTTKETQKPTVSAARVKAGDVVLARKDENGNWVHTSRKTGATPITVTGKQTGNGAHIIEGTDPEGNKVTLQPIRGQNVLHRHQEKAPKAPAAKKAAKAAAPQEKPLSHDEIAKRSAEMLARPPATGGKEQPPLTEADHREMLAGNSKDQLRKIGEDLGVSVSDKDSKASMIDKIAPAAAADTAKRRAERVAGEGPSPALGERQSADTPAVDRVLKAYNDIVAQGDGHDRRVSIADIRAEVGGDLSRAELTRALREIGRGNSEHGGLLSRGVKPDARTEASGMDMGGEKVHFLQLPRPGEKERGKETTPVPKEEPAKAVAKAAKAVPTKAPAKETGDQAEVSKVASAFHADWQKTQAPEGSGRKPKFKTTKDEAWIKKHGTDQVDIANTSYADLPDDWQKENRDAAEVVQRILKEHGGTVDLSDEKTRLEVGDQIHKAWLSRENNSHAKGGELDKPFSELSRAEQDKDTDQLKVAMEVLSPAKKGGTSPETVSAVKQAYENIVARRGPDGDRKVSLQDIRQELDLQHGFSRPEVDKALKELGRGGSEHGGLISGTTNPSNREAAGAMKMGGEDVHFLQLPRPGEAGRGGEVTPNAPESSAEADAVRNLAPADQSIYHRARESGQTHEQAMATVATPAPAAEAKPLEKMTKAELLAHPDAAGAKQSWTKDKIKQHIQAAQGAKTAAAQQEAAKVVGKAAPRPTTPIDNAPRANEFTKAWDTAGIPEAPGSAGRSMKEIRSDLAEGKIDPAEGVRRMESEISFNKEELSQVEADLRAPDLTDKQRADLQAQHAKLTEGVKAQEKASEFLRSHFGGEGDKPTVEEVKAFLPEGSERFLDKATPDEMRDVARIQGLDEPKGSTAEEMFNDLLKQTVDRALKEKREEGASKAAKAEAARLKKEAREAGKAGFRPGGAKHLDAAKIAEGLDLGEDNSYVQDAQAELNDGKTPKQVADRVRFMAQGLANSNAIIHGSVAAGHETPDDKMHRETKLAEGRAAVAKLEELAKRIEESKRPRKPRAPSTKLTPTDHVAAREAAKATGTPVAEVRSAMEDAKKADAKLQELGIPTTADELHARVIARASGPFNDAKTAEEARRAATSMHGNLTLAEIRKMGAEHGITGRSKKDITDKIIERRFPPEPGAPTRLTGGQFDQLKAGDPIDIHLGGSKTRKDSVAKVDPDGTLHTKGGYKYGPTSDVQISRGGAADTRPSTPARSAQVERARKTADVVAEVHELVGNGASPDAIRARLRTAGQANGIDTAELQSLADDPQALTKAADKLGTSAGLSRVGDVGSTTPFNRTSHEGPSGRDLGNGENVRVTRPGHTARLSNGEDVTISRPKVHPVSAEPAKATPAKRAAKKALPGPQASPQEALAALNNANSSTTREEAHGMIEHFTRDELISMAKELSVPSASSKSKKALRDDIVHATVGVRADSEATRDLLRAPRAGDNGFLPTDQERLGGRLAAAKKAAKGAGPAAEPRLSPAAEQARLEQERADNMARLAAAKAVKKAAPTKAAPAKKERFSEAAAEKQFGPQPGEARIESGKFSDKPLRQQTWGGRAQPNDVRFHEDGAIGSALSSMGQDKRLDVGGEPLYNVLGQIATDVNRGNITPAQGLERYKALAARLPEGSNARKELEYAIQKIDSPPRKPNLPEGTPDYLRKLADRLAEIPIARKDVGRTGRKGELDQVEELARLLTDGEPKSRFTAQSALERMMGTRHESDSDAGDQQILAAIQEALKDEERARMAARKAK